MAEENKKHLTGYCPNCSARLEYDPDDSTVTCNCCDSVIDVKRLSDHEHKHEGSDTVATAGALIAASIDTSESGLAYLESLYGTLDWDDFNRTTALTIKAIDDMVEKNKIRNSNNAVTWELELESIYTPCIHKIDGLRDIAKAMAEEYTGLDDTLLMGQLDLYIDITNKLKANVDQIKKILDIDVKFAKQYGANEAKVAELQRKEDELINRISALSTVKNFADIPEICSRMDEINAQIASKLREQGIDAETIYQQAIEQYKANSNLNDALDKLLTLKGYKDAHEYVAKINNYYSYKGEVIIALDRCYTLMSEKRATYNSVNKVKSLAELISRTKTYTLNEIIDNMPSDEPIITNLLQMIGQYGENLFYLKREVTKKEVLDHLCVFNLVKRNETILNSGNADCFKGARFYSNKRRDVFYITKHLSDEIKSGCFNLKKTIVPNEQMKLGNPFELLRLDALHATCKVAIPGLIAVQEKFDNLIFFSRSIKSTSTPSANAANGQEFLQFDTDTDEIKDLLGPEAQVHNVIDGKIIYSVYDPSFLNKTLYTLDIATKTTSIIEKNIYQYFTTMDNRIFYVVGNEQFRSLFSNDVDGGSRHEVMQNVAEVVPTPIFGWLYIIKGYSYNRVLMKISSDGSKRVYVCTGFKSLVKIVNGYVYYIDYEDCLRIVRSDGYKDRIIAENLAANEIVITDDSIFYLRNELVGTQKMEVAQNPEQKQEKKGCFASLFGSGKPSETIANLVKVNQNKFAKSIYRMDLDGHNIRKIAFDVEDMKDFDKDYLYFCNFNNITYSIRTINPDVTQAIPSKVNTYSVAKYFRLNKHTFDIQPVLILGLPSRNAGKTKKGNMIRLEFNEIQTAVKYHQSNVETVEIKN